MESNIALNADLLRAHNDPLSEKGRDELRMAAYEIFMEPSHKEYIDDMLAVIDVQNLDMVFDGYQSIPKPYPFSKHGFNVSLWNNQGTIRTPGYGDTFDPGFYKEDRLTHVVLDFPDNLVDIIGSGSLVIELEVDTRQLEGWLEEVEYSKGPKFEKLRKWRYDDWYSSEEDCRDLGLHLPSILSLEEKETVLAMMDKYGVRDSIWLGGSKLNGKWTWVDGSHWNDSRWLWDCPESDGGHIDGNNCLQIESDGCVFGYNCNYNDGITKMLCKKGSVKIRGKRNITLSFKKEQLTFPSFQVWYRYQASNQQLLESWKDRRTTTGFQLSWRIETMTPLKADLSEVGREVLSPGLWNEDFEVASFYTTHHHFKATLNIPKQQVGNGSLTIILDVNISQEKGWQEEVEYYEGSKYWVTHEKSNQTVGKERCRKEGGQLASVLSPWDQAELEAVTGVGCFLLDQLAQLEGTC